MDATTQHTSAYYAEFVDPLLPDAHAFSIRAEHYMRYVFAQKLLRKRKAKTMYDIACGNGYGTKLLSSTGTKVIGFEKSSELLNTAQKHYINNTVNYVQVQLDEIKLQEFVEQHGLEKPDAIVCFETLEHLKFPEKLLHSFNKLLISGSYLLISTPNADMEPQRDGKSKDPYHLQLFDNKRLTDLLAQSGFHVDAVYGQPYTNILFHHFKIIAFLNTLSSRSLLIFKLLAWIFAYPTTHGINASYSQIIVAVKN